MKRFLALVAFGVVSAIPSAAQSYYAQIDGANCNTLWGYAWDSTQPNTPISIDLYDGGTPVATVLANLAYGGIGNGFHGFSYTIPPSLKDGASHTIVHYITGTHINISGSSGIISCPAGTTGYVPYFTDSLTSISTSNWTQNGGVSGTSAGLTATSTNGGSLISSVAVPDGTSDYEVRTTLTLAATGGTYVSYLRATTNAMTGPAAAGTFYSVEVTPTVSGGSCSAAIVVNKRVSGSITQLTSATVGCHNGSTYRAFIRGTTIGVLHDSTIWILLTDSAISSGNAGVGALATASGNSIASVNLGPADKTAPAAPASSSLNTSVLPTRMDMRFAGVADNASGTGIVAYVLYRGGSFLAVSTIPEFSDATLAPGSTYTYTVYGEDFHANYSTGTNFTITTPPTGSVDPRRIGVRTTGAYWGASPEQIDLRSGNLNLTIPLLSAQMRGGGGVPISLSYNAQNWRKDSGGTWNLGYDVGYGYGWNLSAGSLTPYFAGAWSLNHYMLVDSSGAQYRLDQNSSGVWSSTESLYVWYDSNTNILHFRDGSYWIMGCTSGGSEPDAGTMFPTIIENTNGNQIIIHYNAGNQLPYVNSSARIQSIEDVRAQSLGGVRQTYVFVYNVDVTPHLTSIQNTIGTSEAYQFAFGAMATLYDPFTGTSIAYANALVPLQSMTATGIGMQHAFTYNTSGEMTQVTFPYGGYFKYNYGNVTYSSGFTQPEITSRVMSKDGTSGSEKTYPFTHESSPSSYPSHQFTLLVDPGGVGQKKWSFSTSGGNIGLTTQYLGQAVSGPTTLVQNDFTWTTDSAGNYYIGSTLNTYPGPAYTKTEQTVDVYGNVTQVKKYNFGALTTPARTYNYSYLNSSNYTSRYIYNRLTSATVTDGTTTTYLASLGYDSNSTYVAPFTTNPQEWDTSYASASYRGNVTSSTGPSGSSAYAFDQAGNIASATVNGVTSTATTSTTTNFAAPDALTVGSLSASMTYSTFLAPTSETGPNGDSASASFDTYARPTQTTSPFGATTYYSYSSPPYSSSTPPTVTIHPNGLTGRWTKNTLDGFGRTVKTETGDSTSTKSVSETVYDPCACSPLGKLHTQTMAHAPGASSPTLTTYTYDGIGRTLSVATVGSDTQGTSTYAYSYASYGLYTTVSDPSGNYKYLVTDAFNDLIAVSEPATASEPSGSGTYYYYDLLNHLTTVSMTRTAGTQTRSFTYSGNNLVSATNPENGTVTYTYNSYNKVATKTDAKAQQVAYTYDSLARLTKVQRYPNVQLLKIYAWGTAYAGVYPTMTVSIGYPLGASIIGTYTVTGSGTFYIPTGPLNFSGADVRVTFTNAESTGTRQLIVQYIVIDGTTMYTNDLGGSVYDSCAPGSYSNTLSCTNGYFEYPTTSFSSTPTEDVCQQENYYYDSTHITSYSHYPSGRLTSVQYYGGSGTYGTWGTYGGPTNCDTQFEEAYDYNQAGARVGKKLRVTRDNITWTSHSPGTGSGFGDLDSTYAYDAEGRMTGEQYPVSGPNLGWTFDTMGRLSTMADGGTSVISATTYGPANEMLTMTGSVNETRIYNSMLQLKQMYNGAINISYNYPSSNNNGKIGSQTDNVSAEQVVYTYDALNRLASATATSNAWGQSYSYDGFGNLTAQTVTVGTAPSYSVTPDPATNHVGGTDANGNSTSSIGGATPAYDIENRLATIGTPAQIAYSYAPGNKRVWRGLWTSGSLTTDEVTYWGVTGQKLGSYSITVNPGSGSTQPSLTLTQLGTNYYFGGKLIKKASGYVGADRLGSVGHYYPYGQEKPSATTNGTEKFTGYMRDSETGLDYADQRYHNPGTGRFLTIDLSSASFDPKNPISWNRYVYVLGDPTNGTDPTGKRTCSFETMTCDDGSSPFDENDDYDENCDAIGVTCYQNGGGGGGGDSGGAYTGNCPTNFSVFLNDDGTYTCEPSSADITSLTTDGSDSNDLPIDSPLFGAVVQGIQNAAPVSDPKFIAGWYIASGTVGYIAVDISLVQAGRLFGTRLGGNTPLFNATRSFRVGWSYLKTHQYVFRIGGTAIGKILSDPHIPLSRPISGSGPISIIKP